MSNRFAATICHALEAAARLDQNGVIILAPDGTETRVSHRELWMGACARGAALTQRGVQPGDRVITVLDTSVAFLECFFGIQLAGGVAVPAYPPSPLFGEGKHQRLISHIARVTQARHVVSEEMLLDELRSAPGVDALNLLDIGALRGAAGSSPRMPTADEFCLIQCTSGSTSAPKAVSLKHRAVMDNLTAVAERGELAKHPDVFLSWLPLFHDLGLIAMFLQSISQADSIVLMSPLMFLMDPGAWWRAASKYKATITAAPCSGFGYSAARMTEEEVAALDLSAMRFAVCAGEPVYPDVARRFLKKMAPAGFAPAAFSPCYGLAEFCVAATVPAPSGGLRVDKVGRDTLAEHGRAETTADDDKAQEFTNCGSVIPGAELEIVDANGNRVAERTVGEVLLKGHSQMSEYWSDSAATTQALRGGALCTGDLGYRVGTEVFIVGRIKDVLHIMGRKYNAEDIEQLIERLPGVRKGGAVTFAKADARTSRTKAHVVVETRITVEAELRELETAIRSTVSEDIGLTIDRVFLVPPQTVPKTTSGKKQRSRLRELYEAQV